MELMLFRISYCTNKSLYTVHSAPSDFMTLDKRDSMFKIKKINLNKRHIWMKIKQVKRCSTL